MKRSVLFLLIGIIAFSGLSITASAQMANRKGFILELNGGGVIGTLYDTGNFDADKAANLPAYRRTGGAYGGLNIGYRWSTSRFMAFETKLLIADNFSDTDMLLIGLLPGLRYTSRELFGRTSAYVGINAGCGIAPLTNNDYSDLGGYALTEFNLGMNLNNTISAGIFVDYNICFYGTREIFYKKIPYHGDSEDSWKYERDGYFERADLKSHAVVGLRLGMRF